MKRLFLLLFLILTIITACHKDKYMTSDVEGTVVLYDETGKMLDPSGVKVTLSNFKDSVFTDNSGIYKVEKVPAGTYVITLTKDGFPTRKIYNVQILGNGQATRSIATVGSMHYPTITINNFRDTVINSFLSDIKADINRNGITQKLVIIMYSSHSPNVSLDNYEEQYFLFTSKDYVMLDRDFLSLEKNVYVVFYGYAYSRNFMTAFTDYLSVHDDKKDFILPRDEFGEYYNPYYKKISDVYFYQ